MSQPEQIEQQIAGRMIVDQAAEAVGTGAARVDSDGVRRVAHAGPAGPSVVAGDLAESARRIRLMDHPQHSFEVEPMKKVARCCAAKRLFF